MYRMMIDRNRVKQENKAILQTAQVGPKAMTLLYVGIASLLSLGAAQLPSTDIMGILMGWSSPSLEGVVIAGTFVSVLVTLMGYVLQVGYTLYCMDIRRQEEAEYSRLFDGFAFAGKIVVLSIMELFYIWLWSCLFVFPGIVAAYRYRFAMLNLCQNPDLSATEALNLSKRQTWGYKLQLFTLDVSFFPWMLLSQLPLVFLYGVAFIPALGSIPLPDIWAQDLVCTLWALVVYCFYLPLYQTSELSYFEIAKSSIEQQETGNFL